MKLAIMHAFRSCSIPYQPCNQEKPHTFSEKKKKASLFIILIITGKQFSAMFILVAVNTKVFPVGSIRGIVPVISIFVVYGQEMPVFVSKLPPAFGTDEPVNPERTFSVIAVSGFAFSHFSEKIFKGFSTGCLSGPWPFVRAVSSVSHFDASSWFLPSPFYPITQ
jgi:hypothetical protein